MLVILSTLFIITSGSEPDNYIGCYQDQHAQALRYGPRNYGYTIDSCSEACKQSGYKYFGMQDPGFGGDYESAWCGCDDDLDHITQYGQLTSPCHETYLGGFGTFDLFEIKSGCKYWSRTDPKNMAIPIDECALKLTITGTINDESFTWLLSFSTTCIEESGSYYMETSTFSDSLDCTQSDSNLITTTTTECVNGVSDCNCDGSSDECQDNIASLLHYPKFEGECDTNELLSEIQAIVDICIPIDGGGSYITVCDGEGITSVEYYGDNCDGGIAESVSITDEYTTSENQNDDECLAIQCPGEELVIVTDITAPKTNYFGWNEDMMVFTLINVLISFGLMFIGICVCNYYGKRSRKTEHIYDKVDQNVSTDIDN